jgi:hypothetical protein
MLFARGGLIRALDCFFVGTLVNSYPQNKGLIAESIICGILLTATLTFIASMGDSRAWGCTFAWQACLIQTVIHTPDNPMHEGSPIDLFGFMLGVLMGMPIYSILYYFGLSYWRKKSSTAGMK